MGPRSPDLRNDNWNSPILSQELASNVLTYLVSATKMARPREAQDISQRRSQGPNNEAPL